VFAPTNLAFERLPRRLKLFLFSPFGGKVLEKLLRYHIVPDLVFFSGKSRRSLAQISMLKLPQTIYTLRMRRNPKTQSLRTVEAKALAAGSSGQQ